MNRPTLEVADIIRAVGNRFWEKHSLPGMGASQGARCHRPVPYGGTGRSS